MIRLLLVLSLIAASSLAETKKCGAVMALSGPMASVGVSIKNSIVLAQQRYDPTGQIEFLFEDDQFIPKNTVSALNKLIEIDKIKCLVLFGSSTSLAAVDLAERAKIPTIAIAITAKVTEGRDFILRHYVPVAVQVARLIKEIDRRGYKRIAVITSEQDAALALREEFIKQFKGDVVLDQQFLPSDLDFRATATKISQLGPDAVMLNILPPQTSVGARQLRQSGYLKSFFSGPFLGNANEIKAANGSLTGAWYVSNDDSHAGQFYLDYEKQFGELPEVEGTHGYDVAKALIEALRTTNPNEHLHSLKNFEGVLGTYGVVDGSFMVPAGLRIVNGAGLEPRPIDP